MQNTTTQPLTLIFQGTVITRDLILNENKKIVKKIQNMKTEDIILNDEIVSKSEAIKNYQNINKKDLYDQICNEISIPGSYKILWSKKTLDAKAEKYYYQQHKQKLLDAKEINIDAFSFGTLNCFAFLAAISRDQQNGQAILNKIKKIKAVAPLLGEGAQYLSKGSNVLLKIGKFFRVHEWFDKNPSVRGYINEINENATFNNKNIQFHIAKKDWIVNTPKKKLTEIKNIIENKNNTVETYNYDDEGHWSLLAKPSKELTRNETPPIKLISMENINTNAPQQVNNNSSGNLCGIITEWCKNINGATPTNKSFLNNNRSNSTTNQGYRR